MSKFLSLLKLRNFINAGDSALEVGVNSEISTNPRFRIDAGGTHNWGAGGATATDTTLYRFAADTLKTDDAFIAAGGLTVKTIEIDTASATSGQVLSFNGTKFAPTTSSSGGVSVSDGIPSTPSSGQLWYESDSGKTFIYYDSSWVEVGGGIKGDTGPQGATGTAGTNGTNGDWTLAQTVKPITTGPYTLLTSDAGKLVCWSGSGATTFTVDTATALSVGQRIDFINLTTGILTFAASGVTLWGTPGLKTRAQYSAVSLICIISGIYILVGDLSA